MPDNLVNRLTIKLNVVNEDIKLTQNYITAQERRHVGKCLKHRGKLEELKAFKAWLERLLHDTKKGRVIE